MGNLSIFFNLKKKILSLSQISSTPFTSVPLELSNLFTAVGSSIYSFNRKLPLSVFDVDSLLLSRFIEYRNHIAEHSAVVMFVGFSFALVQRFRKELETKRRLPPEPDERLLVEEQ